MSLSVIIPTYNRLQVLLQALQSLQEQTLPEFEILVVDNAADPEVEQRVEEFSETARQTVWYVPEPKLGLHNARHAGTRVAKGEILVFTDDDASFDPGWLKAYADAFEAHPEMVAAGGPIRPVWETAPPQWLLELMADENTFGYHLFGPLSLVLDPYREFRLGPEAFFWGVNMAIRRDALFQVGGFNPELFGDVWLGDGESGLRRKLRDREMLIGYVPEAVVYHHIPPQRMTVKYLCNRMANEGASRMYGRFHERMPHWFGLSTCAAGIAIRNAPSCLLAVLVGGRTDTRSLHIQMRAAQTQSELAYVIRLMLDKTLRKLVSKEDWLNESRL